MTENNETQERHKFLLQHKEVLLALTPNHGRTSCSDEDPINHYHPTNGFRCTRCFLLVGADSRPFDVELDIQILQSEEDDDES